MLREWQERNHDVARSPVLKKTGDGFEIRPKTGESLWMVLPEVQFEGIAIGDLGSG